MELLGKDPSFNIRGNERSKIYARNNAMPSSYIDEDAKIRGSFVAEGSEIYGTVRHSVISVGCTIGEDALGYMEQLTAIYVPSSAILFWAKTAGSAATQLWAVPLTRMKKSRSASPPRALLWAQTPCFCPVICCKEGNRYECNGYHFCQ